MIVKDIYENALALNLAKPDEDEELEFFAVKLFNIPSVSVFMYLTLRKSVSG